MRLIIFTMYKGQLLTAVITATFQTKRSVNMNVMSNIVYEFKENTFIFLSFLTEISWE